LCKETSRAKEGGKKQNRGDKRAKNGEGETRVKCGPGVTSCETTERVDWTMIDGRKKTGKREVGGKRYQDSKT